MALGDPNTVDKADPHDVATFKRHTRGNVVRACAILVLVMFGLTYAGQRHADSNSAKIARGEKTLRISQLRSCHRLNVIRVSENRSHLDDYNFYKTTAHLLDISLGQPSAPNPDLSVTQHKEDLGLIRSFIVQLVADAADKEWTPLTECYPAVDFPVTYVTPEPVKFSVEMPPPGALEVGSGE